MSKYSGKELGKKGIEKGKKGLFHLVFGRTMVVFLLLLVQVFILLGWFHKLEQYSPIIYVIVTSMSFVFVIAILNSKSNPAYKLAWIIPILIIPFFGVLFYLFIKLQIGNHLIYKKLRREEERSSYLLEQDPAVLEELKQQDPRMEGLARYLYRLGHYPVYQNSETVYFPLGEDKFKTLVEELEKAREFIFLEYFIVREGLMWNTILEILERKVKEGVEVRFMYDGTCSISLLPYSYPRKMQEKGIKCKMFAPIRPALSTTQNNRDHRKILVIDGHTAFTGGINLADEYINKEIRFGHWKDTGVMIKGEAARTFTVLFLQMWNISEKQPEDYARYLHIPEEKIPSGKGFVIPFGENPVDTEVMAEQVYMNILHTAQRYVHIMTPYLILDNEMIQALTFAAKRGVDVHIIMPHIPDKWYAFVLAKTYYNELLDAGVKISEYTPGFIHAKEFVSDDEKAVVGTINLDYRSLYLHYECAALFYRDPVIQEVEGDFQETLKKCQTVTRDDYKNQKLINRICGRVLRLIAPLM